MRNPFNTPLIEAENKNKLINKTIAKYDFPNYDEASGFQEFSQPVKGNINWFKDMLMLGYQYSKEKGKYRQMY